MKKIWYNLFKIYIQIGLFFYTNKVKIVGRKNIPKKGAVLFAVNHPNGLLDPLLVTTNTPRITHYLVRAAIFKKPLVKKFLATLNLMPIYRIRDGVKELSKNTEIFNDCFEILNNKQALMIFPEGSHDKRRSIRPISKGFTRILFGTLNKYPHLQIQVIPVGVTYQNPSQFPCNVAIHYGTPILANDFYNSSEINKSIQLIKEAVSSQLKKLSVHIPLGENYESTLKKLNDSNADFTQVTHVNNMILFGNITPNPKRKNFKKISKILFLLTSIFPWLLWRGILKNIDEFEFIDTFRFGVSISVFPIFYAIQSYCLFHFFGSTLTIIYAAFTVFIATVYSKSSAIQ